MKYTKYVKLLLLSNFLIEGINIEKKTSQHKVVLYEEQSYQKAYNLYIYTISKRNDYVIFHYLCFPLCTLGWFIGYFNGNIYQLYELTRIFTGCVLSENDTQLQQLKKDFTNLVNKVNTSGQNNRDFFFHLSEIYVQGKNLISDDRKVYQNNMKYFIITSATNLLSILSNNILINNITDSTLNINSSIIINSLISILVFYTPNIEKDFRLLNGQIGFNITFMILLNMENYLTKQKIRENFREIMLKNDYCYNEEKQKFIKKYTGERINLYDLTI